MKLNFTAYSRNGSMDIKAERIEESEQVEKWKVQAKGKAFLFQTNRPLISGQGSKKRIAWKLINGSVDDMLIGKEIAEAIEHELKMKDWKPWNKKN